MLLSVTLVTGSVRVFSRSFWEGLGKGSIYQHLCLYLKAEVSTLLLVAELQNMSGVTSRIL